MEVLRVGQMSITLYMTDPSIPSIFCLFFWKESQEMMLQQEGNPWGAPCSQPGVFPPSPTCQGCDATKDTPPHGPQWRGEGGG